MKKIFLYVRMLLIILTITSCEKMGGNPQGKSVYLYDEYTAGMNWSDIQIKILKKERHWYKRLPSQNVNNGEFVLDSYGVDDMELIDGKATVHYSLINDSLYSINITPVNRIDFEDNMRHRLGIKELNFPLLLNGVTIEINPYGVRESFTFTNNGGQLEKRLKEYLLYN